MSLSAYYFETLPFTFVILQNVQMMAIPCTCKLDGLSGCCDKPYTLLGLLITSVYYSNNFLSLQWEQFTQDSGEGLVDINGNLQVIALPDIIASCEQKNYLVQIIPRFYPPYLAYCQTHLFKKAWEQSGFGEFWGRISFCFEYAWLESVTCKRVMEREELLLWGYRC